ncbi:cilia- and flagella-associated protein 157-like [Scylla paramamosain]|uniref:cilia- and flagella-associated protein 157-like n=1 Tax=Scylla paramamosain TaxID=85552 RepID=UPI0030833454
MAPKGGKKGGKKKGGKKKDKGEEEEEGEQKEAISELDKHFYLNQIHGLEVKLKRATIRCEQLVEAESHARGQYDLLMRDKTDVINFLKARLSSTSDEVEELRSRLAGLVKAKEAEQQQYEERLATLAKDAENTRLDLNDKIIALTRKLESLEEFRQHKEELEGKLSALEEELATSREEHKEKVSYLERASLVEAAAQRAELEARITRITEDLRRAAQTEMHSTTRRALQENEALTRQLEVFRSRITALRTDNNNLRDALSDSQVREGLLQDTVRQVTARGERRARLLQAVTEKAEEQARVWRDYHRLARDNTQLRRDLQAVQSEVDSATQTACDLRQRMVEKDVALELTACHLRQQEAARSTLQEAITSALSLLHQAAFQSETTKEVEATGAILQQLVTLLTSAEQAQLYATTEPAHPSPPTVAQGGGGRDDDVQKEGRREGSGQVQYRAGDLGLLPRPSRKARSTTPD